MDNINNYLEKLYEKSLNKLGSSNEITLKLDNDKVKKSLDVILSKSESAKGVLTVSITSLVYKIHNRKQDVRLHQANMKGGYSGRSFDTANITPFLKANNFPAMAESGWLTRSLEQNRPYDKDYSGSIRPTALKDAFINTMHEFQFGKNQELILQYIFQYLILQRNKFDIQLAKPTNLSISDVVILLKRHFESKYSSEGASRLPALAFYAIYLCLLDELQRFRQKKLLPIESHTSADSQSGRIGDLDVIDDRGRVFEAVEIKHGIPISVQIVKDAYTKFSTTPVKRYYILSTSNILESDKDAIFKEINNIKRIHGCQVIVNGIVKSLNYYLRLLSDTFDFVENYVKLLEKDEAIKFEHKLKWNELINSKY